MVVGALIAVAFLSLHWLLSFKASTFERGREAGIADAKAYIRYQICLRQQFADAKAIAAASKADRETAVRACIARTEWPDPWRTELDPLKGSWRKTPGIAEALDDSFVIWLWNGGKVEPVRDQNRPD
jgi:hypothetical protein